jgi:hypothetical protein
MPLFFQCSDPKYVVYMGKDKFENEELLKYGFPEDIWFHVDKLSSAHVYLRLPSGAVDLTQVKSKDEAKQKLREAMESVPEEIVYQMCQLTKANSIEGCKLAEADVVYTPFLNLKKEERMDTGQVGFQDESFRRVIKNVPKDKEIVKKLEKTREERSVDLKEEREQRDAEERERRRAFNAEVKRKEKEEKAQKAEEKALKTYAAFEDLDKTSNKDISHTGSIEECRDIEDDFM